VQFILGYPEKEGIEGDLLDSGAVEELMKPGSETAIRAARKPPHAVLGTCFPVLGELWYGLELSAIREANLKRLQRVIAQLILWPYESQAAAEFGRIKAQLRRIGRPMQVVDMQLAAVAFALGNTTVVTMDSDLSAIPGLSVEDWSKPEATP